MNTYTKNNQVELVPGGKKYFDLLLSLIQNATSSIHLQTYIFADDQTGIFVADALKSAAVRGVQVYLLVDGYASKNLTPLFVNQLQTVGIHFRFFEPIFKSSHFYFGRRLHHKVIVIDVKYGLIGGLNVANHYNDLPENPSWLDFAVLVEGEIVQQLCTLCWKTWNGFTTSDKAFDCANNLNDRHFDSEQQVNIKMIRNDWVRGKNEISKAYLSMFQSSKREITILCSYFFPGKKIRRQMLKAAQRGVKIKVIVAGLSDVLVAKYAERWLYTWLLRNKITIYEYQKNILHAKVAVCDDSWMTIGSYNINDISAYASIELNLELQNAAFCGEVRQLMDTIIATDCIEITTEHSLKTNTLYHKLVCWLAYRCTRILFYLFTFYFKKQS